MKARTSNSDQPDLRLLVSKLSERLDRVEGLLHPAPAPAAHAPASKIAVVQASVAQAYGLNVTDLTGPRRTAEIALARQVAMTLAYRINPSLIRIAEAFNRQHGTVIHALQTVTNRKQTDRRFLAQFESVSEIVGKALRQLEAA